MWFTSPNPGGEKHPNRVLVLIVRPSLSDRWRMRTESRYKVRGWRRGAGVRRTCWIYRSPVLNYGFIVPYSLMVIANVCLFIATSVNIRRIKKNVFLVIVTVRNVVVCAKLSALMWFSWLFCHCGRSLERIGRLPFIRRLQWIKRDYSTDWRVGVLNTGCQEWFESKLPAYFRRAHLNNPSENLEQLDSSRICAWCDLASRRPLSMCRTKKSMAASMDAAENSSIWSARKSCRIDLTRTDLTNCDGQKKGLYVRVAARRRAT